MKQVHLLDGPFTGHTADGSRIDGQLKRFVMLWRVDNTPPRGSANVKDWACLYHLDGLFDTTLEDQAARPFYERGHHGCERWQRDHNDKMKFA